MDSTIEVLESAVEILDRQSRDLLKDEVGDWVVGVSLESDRFAERLGGAASDEATYAVRKAARYADELRMRVRGASGANRTAGYVEKIKRDAGYGFVYPNRFFHVRDCVDRTQWDSLEVESLCVFTEANGARGPRATLLRLLQW